MDKLIIRAPAADEAAALTDLAMTAKASWGYDAAFMEACRAELTITPQLLAAWRFWVAELDGRIVGMIALSLDGGHAQLEDFFVDPAAQGGGIGRRLMDELLRVCRASGATALEVDADPNAEGIYERLGFRTIGRSPSGSIPGRTLPRMTLALA
jgi:GNAT superfamily N-acetyltransferase